jgi:hypothetical protein
MSLLGTAMDFAALGIPSFPVCGKLPLTEHGFEDADAAPATLESWWRRYPDANIGIPTGLTRAMGVIAPSRRSRKGTEGFRRHSPPKRGAVGST